MIPPPPRSTLFPYTTLFRSKPEPFFEAVEDLRAGPPIVLLSARGRPFSHRDAVRFAVGRELTLLCGHYKDVDQRVADGLGARSEERRVGRGGSCWARG